MPYKPKRPCRVKRCPNLTDNNSGYCEQHEQQELYKDNKSYNETRVDKEHSKFYSTARWRKLRALKLRQDPLCKDCKGNNITTLADMVHHDEEIKEGGQLLPPLEELTSLCWGCHNKRHKGVYGGDPTTPGVGV